MPPDRIVPHVACLGCGCVCDDIEVVLQSGRIAAAHNACALGTAWFGDGALPDRAAIAGRDVAVEAAVAAAAEALSHAAAPLVYLAPEISWETQREVVALADVLGAALDSVTSATALESVLAAQERGRASATLGEARNRADLVVFWGVDPAHRYPRYTSRYAPEPAGLHVPDGRRSRTVIAIDVEDVPSAHGPADADRRFGIRAADEVATLTAVTAIVSGGRVPAAAARDHGIWAHARELADWLRKGRYVVIVADGERSDDDSDADRRDPARTGALIALAQALNGPTRCALSTLRAGGNRSGADALLTWQTGYPLAADFARGYPRYRPHDGTAADRLNRGEVDVILAVGAASGIPEDLRSSMARVDASAAIGPRASESMFAARGVVIDTGIAGVHEDGTALRMDDVPLPLRALVPRARTAASIVRALREAVSR